LWLELLQHAQESVDFKNVSATQISVLKYKHFTMCLPVLFQNRLVWGNQQTNLPQGESSKITAHYLKKPSTLLPVSSPKLVKFLERSF